MIANLINSVHDLELFVFDTGFRAVCDRVQELGALV